ncbi:MAG: ornithine cyclodeaminase family protein [Burkholderiales bacterium]|nr:ornithine cyclodeaminase family protein [Burkholderiales bacterium]
MHDTILYLSEADVAATDVSLARLRECIAAAFAAQARGIAHTAPKSVLDLGRGHTFQAKPAAMAAQGLAGMKWFGLVPAAQASGPTINSLIVLSDIDTGAVVAMMGGNWITATRTAAMTAIAAQRLARADSRSIGFIGCGVQARSHFDALRLVLPGLTELVACGRSAASAERFAAMASAAGLTARTTREPREAVEGMDVVITTVPDGADVVEFLDTAWVARGAFVGAVDLARSWKRDGLRALDILATDEHEQTRTLAAAGRMTFAGPYDADLADLASGAHEGRSSATQRAMFSFSGHALADLAAAQVVYETALDRGLGTRLVR